MNRLWCLLEGVLWAWVLILEVQRASQLSPFSLLFSSYQRSSNRHQTGSIRHPCSFTGLYGLRPSHGRVSYQNVSNTYVGQEAVRSCAGPMCRSPSDIHLFMSTIVSQQTWLSDPQILPIPWRRELEALPEKLCFGFGMGDGSVQPSPPLRRAMNITKAALMAAGHSFVDFIPSEHIEAAELIGKFWSADGGEEFRRDVEVSGEPLHAAIEGWLGRSTDAKPQSVAETWRNQARRTELATRWLERWVRTKEITGTGRPIDGLIMPGTPFPAIRHNGGYHVSLKCFPFLASMECFSYVSIYSCLLVLFKVSWFERKGIFGISAVKSFYKTLLLNFDIVALGCLITTSRPDDRRIPRHQGLSNRRPSAI